MIIDTLLKNIDEHCHHMAVVSQSESLTYHQLGSNAVTMSKHLLDAGINKGKVVAIFSDRSAVTITAMVAVMLAGAAYTIVEEENLEENCRRLCAIDPDLVLCRETHVSNLTQAGLQVISYDYAQRLTRDFSTEHRTLKHQPSGDDIAYLLYTSGSTGKPKGVEITHSNITHYTQAIQSTLQVGKPLNYAHLSTLAADLGNTSLFLCLATGGCLHLLAGDVRKDPRKVIRYFFQHNINFVKITPSHWQAIFCGAHTSKISLPKLDYLIFGGEALPKSLANEVLSKGLTNNLFNHYGPTETTVGVTAFHIKNANTLATIEGDTVPIGRPFGNTQLFVKDDSGDFVKDNAEGELYITGPSVAHGYRNRLEATQSSFIDIAALAHTPLRAYKTGDRVSIDRNGILYFKGRIDRQVKVNGYRVELEHIEGMIKTIDNVKDAVVIYPEILGKHTLIAAVVSERYGESIQNIKHQAAGLMPNYMIPTRFIYMLDFPRNANGKTNIKDITSQLIEDITKAKNESLESLSETEGAQYTGEELDLFHSVHSIFSQYLKLKSVPAHASFNDLGGDSLLSIQLIADLQYKNLDISANEFMQKPTIDGVIKAIISNRKKDVTQNHESYCEAKTPTITTNFSPAQDHFFKQRLTTPNHYNQSVFFRIEGKINPEHLQRAFYQACQDHELLRTRFKTSGPNEYVKPVAERMPSLADSLFSISDISRLDSDSQRQHINTTANTVQQAINIEDGKVVMGHLYLNDNNVVDSADSHCHYLLLVAHHLCVDVISWRIIINEMSRLYGQLQSDMPIQTQVAKQRFWNWVDHLDHEFSDFSPEELAQSTRKNVTEGETKSYWFGYTELQTQALTSAAQERNIPLHLLILGTLAHQLNNNDIHCPDTDKLSSVLIDVESHGRVSLADDIDVSRVVGWHTSTFPLTIDINKYDIETTCQNTRVAFDKIDHLGVGFGVHEKSNRLATPSPLVCYNFLGDTDFNHDNRLPLRPCPLPTGQTRGQDNIRSHNIKVSARISRNQLIVDVSYPASQNSRLAKSLRQSLNDLAITNEPYMAAVCEAGSKTGMIHYVPNDLLGKTQSTTERDYKNILLTGVTGYIGIYALHELLIKTKTHIHCLIRPTLERSAQQRLEDSLHEYFPALDWAQYQARMTVISGDLSQHQWNITDQNYQTLCRCIDAVYHFAADTRLLGSEEELTQANITPLKQLLEFCQQSQLKDMHYMSTLAVSGVNSETELKVFHEDTLDIGQEFQNSYEKTKFECERLINQFTINGHSGFIYRTGNVSGNSVTAQFQRNASDNRLIQFLNSCIKLGRLPRNHGEPITLSPVDTVAAGVISLSTDRTLKPGTYHIDSNHVISMSKLFEALEHKGISFSRTNADDFKSLFQKANDNLDPDIIRGRFWSSRKPRNIIYNHQRTDNHLKRHGIVFSPIDQVWILSFLGQLIEKDALKKPNAEIFHIERLQRRRIFDIPKESPFPKEAS